MGLNADMLLLNGRKGVAEVVKVLVHEMIVGYFFLFLDSSPRFLLPAFFFVVLLPSPPSSFVPLSCFCIVGRKGLWVLSLGLG